MAKVNWSAGIDSVSGALAKPSKSGQHSCNKMLLGTHRVAPTTNPNCNRIYMRNPIERSTPLTPNEIEARDKFTAVATMVNERAHDLSKVSADQEAFLAQRNEPGGKKTIKSWYWYVCGKEYDESLA